MRALLVIVNAMRNGLPYPEAAKLARRYVYGNGTFPAFTSDELDSYITTGKIPRWVSDNDRAALTMPSEQEANAKLGDVRKAEAEKKNIPTPKEEPDELHRPANR